MLYGDDGDYELAIKCGSNLVRVGSKIFKEEQVMRQLVHYYKDFNTFQKWCKGHKVKNSNKLIIEITIQVMIERDQRQYWQD